MAGGRGRREVLYKWNVGQMLCLLPQAAFCSWQATLQTALMLLQKYYICETPWVRSLKRTDSQFQSKKRDLAMITVCWPILDSCCKTQTESQTFLTLRHIKKDLHSSDSHRQAWVGSVSLKPVFFPSVPLSPFPEASCTSLTARFLSSF